MLLVAAGYVHPFVIVVTHYIEKKTENRKSYKICITN
jgi:hypothetical protein